MPARPARTSVQIASPSGWSVRLSTALAWVWSTSASASRAAQPFFIAELPAAPLASLLAEYPLAPPAGAARTRAVLGFGAGHHRLRRLRRRSRHRRRSGRTGRVAETRRRPLA